LGSIVICAISIPARSKRIGSAERKGGSAAVVGGTFVDVCKHGWIVTEQIESGGTLRKQNAIITGLADQ
jgi:hypothetical protein